MIRRIECPKCFAKHPNAHPQDAAEGWKRRTTAGKANKPQEHFIEVITDAERTREDLPSLLCDSCGTPLPDGADIVAITEWREEEPLRWEEEYLK